MLIVAFLMALFMIFFVALVMVFFMIIIHLILKIDVVIDSVAVDRDVGEPIVRCIIQAKVNVVGPFAIQVGITELVASNGEVFTVHEEFHR